MITLLCSSLFIICFRMILLTYLLTQSVKINFLHFNNSKWYHESPLWSQCGSVKTSKHKTGGQVPSPCAQYGNAKRTWWTKPSLVPKHNRYLYASVQRKCVRGDILLSKLRMAMIRFGQCLLCTVNNRVHTHACPSSRRATSMGWMADKPLIGNMSVHTA